MLETQYGVGNAAGGGGGFGGGSQFGGSMSGPAMPDMSEFYRAMAEKQAEAENYKRQQQADALARQQEAQSYERRKAEQAQQYAHKQDRRSEILQDNRLEQMKHQQGIAQTQPEEMHWFKNFGIGKGGDFGGPVEVAPGTFGAYRASIGAQPGVAAAAAQRGLTPGLAGQRLGGVDRLLGEANNEMSDEERKRRQDAENGGRMNANQAWGF
jgi:hypothetical protein